MNDDLALEKANIRLNSSEADDLFAFALAGAGFKTFQGLKNFMGRWSDSYVAELTVLFNNWRGNRSIDEFYRFFLVDNGYRCEELFETCYHGGTEVSCCDAFYSTFVPLRGRCFRMKRLFQEDVGAAGRFIVFMRQLPSPLMEPDGMQRNIVLYLSDNFNDVLWFPRFYINRNSYVQMLFAITRYQMSPKQGCWPIAQEGMSFCIIGEWLRAHVITPLACIPFYLRHHAPSAEVCPPDRIVRNYDDFVNVTNLNRCLPACYRKIVRVLDFSGRRDFDGGKMRPFAISFVYDRLETNRYDEVVLTTLPGFISQIGGQFGLMLGICIVSIVHLAVGAASASARWLNKARR